MTNKEKSTLENVAKIAETLKELKEGESLVNGNYETKLEGGEYVLLRHVQQWTSELSRGDVEKVAARMWFYVEPAPKKKVKK